MIVRWGLAELPAVLGELNIDQPLLVASERLAGTNIGVRTAARWTEVPSDQVEAATEHAGDGVIALGGGSAIDLGKAISAAADVPVVSVPTTYSGAEWTTFYGIRDPERRMRGAQRPRAQCGGALCRGPQSRGRRARPHGGPADR